MYACRCLLGIVVYLTINCMVCIAAATLNTTKDATIVTTSAKSVSTVAPTTTTAASPVTTKSSPANTTTTTAASSVTTKSSPADTTTTINLSKNTSSGTLMTGSPSMPNLSQNGTRNGSQSSDENTNLALMLGVLSITCMMSGDYV